MEKITVVNLQKMKQEHKKITMLTCYDYPMARIMNEVGIDILLVGDSLSNVILGYENTLPVSMEEMLIYTKAVKRGNSRALLVADMPFLSYQIKPAEAVRNAGRFIKEAGAEAVKIEGGREMTKTIKALLKVGIPVMGHIGLTPQSIHKFGGYRVQGRDEEAGRRLLEDARILEQAGVFSIVLESIPWRVAKRITESISIPTIGIGAGKYCTGQVLVIYDLLGISGKVTPRFVKKYANLEKIIKKAIARYKTEVEEDKFPSRKYSY